MHATITSDASYNRKEKIGTYAFWIGVNSVRIKRAGLLKSPIERAEEAEFKCIINALHVLRSFNVENLDRVIINTDCLNVIHVCKKNRVAIQKYRLSFGAPLFKKFDSLIKQMNVKVQFRHIRSHQKIDTKASFVNDWCDKEAKSALSKELAKIESKRILELAKKI